MRLFVPKQQKLGQFCHPRIGPNHPYHRSSISGGEWIIPKKKENYSRLTLLFLFCIFLNFSIKNFSKISPSRLVQFWWDLEVGPSSEADPPEAEELFHRRLLQACACHGDALALMDLESGGSLSFAQLRQRAIRLATVLGPLATVGRSGELRGKSGECGAAALLALVSGDCGMRTPELLIAAALCGMPLAVMELEEAEQKDDEQLALLLARTRCRLVLMASGAGNSCVPTRLVRHMVALGIPLLVLDCKSGQPGIDLDALLLEEAEEEDASRQEQFLAGRAPDRHLTLDHPFLASVSDANKDGSHFDELAQTTVTSTTIAIGPFSRTSGLWTMCQSLLAGHCTVVLPKFDAFRYLAATERYKVDHLRLGPAHVAQLLANPEELRRSALSCVRSVLLHIADGSPPDVGQNKLLMAHLPGLRHFLIAWAPNELVPIASHTTPMGMDPTDERTLTSVGHILPGIEYKIVNCQTGKPSATDRGELWLRSPSVTRGYVGESELLDPLGWLHTGILVKKDVDQLFFVLKEQEDGSERHKMKTSRRKKIGKDRQQETVL